MKKKVKKKDQAPKVVEMRQRRAKSKAPELEGKQAEQALGDSEERYRLLLDTMNEGFSMVDKNQVRIYANHRLCEILGYEPEEVVGQPAIHFLDEANKKIAKEQFAKRKRGESSAYELTFTRKDGRKIPTIVSGRPIFDSKGQFKGAFSVITDITELQKAHNELELRVEERTEELTKTNEELQAEIAKRKRAEEELEKARAELERRVEERTAELVKTKEQLGKAVRYL